MKKALSRKNLWDSVPHRVKSILGRVLGVLPPGYLLGARFRSNLRFAMAAQWWPWDRSRDYQLEHLRRVSAMAYERTRYYRRLFDSCGFRPGDLKSMEDFEKLPTLDRRTMQQNLGDMCTVPADSPGVDYVSTGGSSGEPFHFYIDSGRSAIEYAYLLATWARCGYALGIPLAVFRGRLIPAKQDVLPHEYDPVLRHHYYSNFHMTEANMRAYLTHVSRLGDCYMHVYPSAALCLAKYMRRAGIAAPANVRGLIAESETIYPDQRSAIEELFGRRMFACYGHSEKLVLAGECEHSTDYHVWPTYGHFELLDEQGRPVTVPGERGEIVGTGFMNTVVPFIRYRTGDHATYVGEKCDLCGRESPIIRGIEGRWPSGALVANDGSLISMTALNVHDDTFAHVQRFQFYQDTPGQSVLRIVPTAGFGDQDRLHVERSMGAKLAGRIMFSVEIVESIPLTMRGKMMYIDQRVQGVGQ